MIGFRYIIGNQTIETINLTDIPDGVSYETFEVKINNEEIIQVPNEVALWKLRFILAQIGLENLVVDAMDKLPEPQKTAATYIWNYGNTIDRYSSTILFIQSVLQLTDEQVNNIYIQSNSLTL